MQTAVNIKRYKQIVDVLLKWGFGEIFLEELSPGLAKMNLSAKLHPDIAGMSVNERMRHALEDLGPTFVKFGQILSTHRELISPEMYDELEKLQDKVAPLPFEQIKPVVEEYCGPLAETFDVFETVPIASASIAQVHEAVLKDGSHVAVKVQRPGIRELIEMDLPVFQKMAGRIEKLSPDARVYNPKAMVEAFAVQIMKELDFIREGKNAETLAAGMRDIPDIKVPKIFWKYSGQKVLVMEFVRGCRIDDVETIRSYGVDPVHIADIGFHAYIRQIFRDGFFHADPHPGNLLVSREGELIFLDFGMVAVIRPERRKIFIKVLLSIVENDVDTLIDCFEKLGLSIRQEDVEPLKDELYESLRDYQSTQISQFNVGSAMSTLPKTLQKYHLIVPSSLMMMLKVIWMVFDIAVDLDPGFNFNERVKPYFEEIIESSYLSQEALRKIPLSAMELIEGFMNIPRAINQILRSVTGGHFKLEVAADDLKTLSAIIKQASDRVLIGLIIAALVIGSSVVVHASDTPITGSIFYLAFLVYLIAIVIAIIAIVSLFRKK
jgi:ubiquinone biosynthesis protein